MRESKQGKRGRPKKNYKTAVIRVHEKLKALLENDAEGQHIGVSDMASYVLAVAYKKNDIARQVLERPSRK